MLRVARSGGTARFTEPSPLGQRDERPEKGAGLRRVKPVVDVRRVALRVAGDRDAHLRERLVRSRTEELRAARVAAARAAFSSRVVLRDLQPALVQRVELTGREP